MLFAIITSNTLEPDSSAGETLWGWTNNNINNNNYSKAPRKTKNNSPLDAFINLWFWVFEFMYFTKIQKCLVFKQKQPLRRCDDLASSAKFI